MTARIGVLLVGHGSRVAGANDGFEALVDRYRAAHPQYQVSHGYVELAQPTLLDALTALAKGVTRLVVAPVFLFAAGHVKNDLPLAIATVRRSFPHLRIDVARAFGVHQRLAELTFERARATSVFDLEDCANTAVVVVGRGSSDPDANADFCKLVRIVGEGRGLQWVLPCFVGITDPRFEAAIELVARARPARIIVLPYFLFSGRLIEKLHEQLVGFRARYPWIRAELGAHLGAGNASAVIAEIIDERVAEAMSGAAPLPCDTCQYRAPVGGVAHQVGGLQALLWSVRHSLTHSQAMPHEHAHKPLRKHVLVCGNIDCAAKGSIPLLSRLRRLVKEAGVQTTIRVTKTACLGRCGEGPTVSVYPDGVWYRGVSEADAGEILHEHLLGDRLVARLVDNIMQ